MAGCAHLISWITLTTRSLGKTISWKGPSCFSSPGWHTSLLYLAPSSHVWPHMHSTRLWYTFSTITRNREMESRPKCNSSKSFFKFWGTLTGTSILSQFTGQFESKICTTSFEMSAILIWVNWLWMREWNILVTKLNKSLWTNFWLSHLISNHWSTSMLLLDY